MADISKIKINNVSHNIKDTQAHSSLNSLSQSITTGIVRTGELHLPKTGNDVVIEYDQTTQSVTFTTTALGQQGAETKTISLPVVMNGEVAVKEKSFGKVWYDSGRMRIYFLTEDTEFDNDGNPIGSTSEHTIAILDATPFVKDAMVSNVAITGGNLVITWNSDAGIQPTSIPLTDIFNPANYYNKDEIDQIIADVEAGQVDIVDNLTTNDATKALSAKQGKVLQDNKANKNEMTVTDVTGDATKKTIQLKSGTSQTVVVEHQDISGKQDKINDLSTIRSGAGKGATSVQTISVNNGTPMQPTNGNVDITIPSAAWADVKPSGGVPKSDLATGVQTSLGKADSAIQGVKVNGTELTPDSTKKVDVTVPTKLSDLTADATHRLVTDTEKNTWNSKQNAISDLATIRSGASLGATALQSYTETDPTVPAWAKQSTKPSYTASEVGAVPTTRTVNGKALNNNITLSASDVGADVFVVNIESDGNNGYTCDKTNAEIYAAWQAGRNIVLITSNGYLYKLNLPPSQTDCKFSGDDYDDISSYRHYSIFTSNGQQKVTEGYIYLQEYLQSGTNIKTINNQSLLGSGNLTASDIGALPSSTHIPADQVQSNWNETNTSSKAYIQNKPSFKTINGESIVGTGDVTVQGEQGPAGTIAIGSVSSGTSASVTNSGTASSAVLDFVLPKGAKGDKGDKGDTGASGVHVGDTVIEQTTGSSTTSLMSQKAVTDAISNANIFSQQYGVMGFKDSTKIHSTENYRTFPFDDLKFVDVSSRVYFRNKDYGNGSEFSNVKSLFQIKADSSNYLTVIGEGFNLRVKLFKDGQLIHQSDAFGRSDSVLHLHNHNIRFDLINKNIVFTTADRAGSISTTYMVDISDWDFSGLSGKQVSFDKYFSRYIAIYWLYTFVKVNEPITTTLTLHTRPYSVMSEFPRVDYYDTISREPTGLNNTGLSVTETISATHKKFSKTSEGKAYVSFFASGTNAFVNEVPLIHGVKFKLLSGSPTVSFGQGGEMYVLGDDGTLTSLWGYDFAENTEYVIISDIIIGFSTQYATTASYKSTYAINVTGVFTCEVSEPFVIYPQYQMLCSENIVDGVFQGNIPFSADGASLVPYTPNQNISNSYVYYHLGELKVDNGNVYMWNGVAWKQISN